MKRISEHLGEIIVALAGIMLIIGVISLFSAPIGSFFSNIIEKETNIGGEVLDSIEYTGVGVTGGGGSGGEGGEGGQGEQNNQYTIIEGAGQTYTTGRLSFTSNAPFSKFAGVKVNNELVDPVNYTVEEGSTIITFTEEYSKVLANGDYTIEVLATDGAASAPFDVNIEEELGELKWTGTWEEMTWTGDTSFIPDFSDSYVWSDGTNTYYSYQANQYVLNGSAWEPKTWYGMTNAAGVPTVSGAYIWTDGTNIYYSYADKQYVLNGDTWSTISFGGLSTFYGDYIWTDGTNTYYSKSSTQYVLNGTTWNEKTWTNLTSFNGSGVWTDGTDIYYSNSSDHYVLVNGDWEPKTWYGLTNSYGNVVFAGTKVWSDGDNTYYSDGTKQYILNGDTWEEMTWNGLTKYAGSCIWTDGTNTYYSKKDAQYVLAEVHSYYE